MLAPFFDCPLSILHFSFIIYSAPPVKCTGHPDERV